jgi:hypothetical protein
MPERQRGRAVPPQEPQKEQAPEGPYYKAARYPDETAAGIIYRQAQEFLFTTPCDLSTFRLDLPTGWHVAVLGAAPAPALSQQVDRLLATGEPAVLPDDILTMLYQRREQATKIAPWVEGHHRPGLRFRRRKP